MAASMTDTVAEHKPIEQWVALMSAAQLPVLARTLQQITRLRADEENVRPRDISHLVLHDPLMALRVLRFLRESHGKRGMTDITTIEHAVMMLGVSPFFRTFSRLRSVDTDLASDRNALQGLMSVIARARHAAMHAGEWAQLRHDIESDEVVIATLLHDMAEMLLWYFAPLQAAQIDARLAGDPAQRSTEVQREVLGFSLNELQLALSSAWGLPPLITSLMDDYRAERPRARNVLFAVNLARHCANGWEDAALPDDIEGIRKLIGRPVMEVRQRVFHTAIEAGHDHLWYGDRSPAIWLPPFPLDVEHGDNQAGPRISGQLLVRVRRMLAAEESADLFNWAGSGAPRASGPSPTLPAVVALVFHGLYKGAGLARQVYFSLDETGVIARARYLGGVRNCGRLAYLTLSLGMVNPLTRELAEQGVLWWKGEDDPRPLTDLPRDWRVAAAKGGFFAAMIRTSDGRPGLMFADGGAESRRLPEERFDQFTELCGLLSVKLAGPLPDPAQPD
jgi:HD-like signal output (HDOD) protein